MTKCPKCGRKVVDGLCQGCNLPPKACWCGEESKQSEDES